MAVLGTQATRFAAVRKLAGNLDSDDISDAVLLDAMERADNDVCTMTNKFTWSSSDAEFLTVLSASNLNTAAEIREGIGGQDNATIAGNQRIAARDLIKGLNRIHPDQGEGEMPDLEKTEQTEGD